MTILKCSTSVEGMDFSQEKMTQQNRCITCLYQRYYESALRYRYKYQNVYSNARLMQRSRGRKQLWRPWVERSQSESKSFQSHHNTKAATTEFCYDSDSTQAPVQFQHPVKLVWPKKPVDYMYSEGVQLLKDFPVQATLEFVDESDSEDDEDDYDDECIEEGEKNGKDFS